jgi:hypothetical protein
MALEKELATFQAHLSELVSTDEGKYALVHGEEITVWDSQDKAIDEGYDRYGLEQFLVKEIVEHEVPRHFSRRVTRCQ